MPTRRRPDDIPMSIESVRRHVSNIVKSVERETGQFVNRYSGDIGSPDSWPSFADHVCSIQGAGKTPFQTMTDFRDLDPVLQRIKNNEQLASSQEYVELRRMVERGKLFDFVAFSLRNDLVEAFENQLQRYCLSFHEEARGIELESVVEYQRIIDDCRRLANDRLQHVDRQLDNVDKYKKSLPHYINNYATVVGHMEDACRAMTEACEPLKRWAIADAKYPRRLQDEIGACARRKTELAEVVKHLMDERRSHEEKMRRANNTLGKLDTQLKEAKEQKVSLRRRETDVEQGYTKTEAELSRKKKDLQQLRARISSRQENSTALYNYMVGMSEAIRSECRAHEDKLGQMEHQMDSLRKDQALVQRRIEQIAADHEATRRAKDSAVDRLAQHDEQLRLIREDIDKQDQKIAALKAIREAKLHSDTIKKIHQYGYNPDQIIEQQDETRTAFLITGEEIGKDWVWLYQQLPFQPPRDFRQRELDTEVIDLNHRRLDSSYTMLCVKALEKWHRQSQVASIDELIQTLRRMKRYRAIDRIRAALAAINAERSSSRTTVKTSGTSSSSALSSTKTPSTSRTASLSPRTTFHHKTPRDGLTT